MAFATPDTPMRPDIAAFLKAIAEHFSGERVDVHPPSDYGRVGAALAVGSTRYVFDNIREGRLPDPKTVARTIWKHREKEKKAHAIAD